PRRVEQRETETVRALAATPGVPRLVRHAEIETRVHHLRWPEDAGKADGVDEIAGVVSEELEVAARRSSRSNARWRIDVVRRQHVVARRRLERLLEAARARLPMLGRRRGVVGWVRRRVRACELVAVDPGDEPVVELHAQPKARDGGWIGHVEGDSNEGARVDSTHLRADVGRDQPFVGAIVVESDARLSRGPARVAERVRPPADGNGRRWHDPLGGGAFRDEIEGLPSLEKAIGHIAKLWREARREGGGDRGSVRLDEREELAFLGEAKARVELAGRVALVAPGCEHDEVLPRSERHRREAPQGEVA